MTLLGRGVRMPGELCECKGPSVRWLGTASLARCGRHGFVVMALALGFRGIEVWACGLGSREATGFYLAPQFWKKYLYFFRSILMLANISSNYGGCGGSSFLTFLFSWPGLGLGAVKASFGVLAGACLVCFWSGVGLVCSGPLFCASLILGVRDTFE